MKMEKKQNRSFLRNNGVNIVGNIVKITNTVFKIYALTENSAKGLFFHSFTCLLGIFSESYTDRPVGGSK